MSDRLRWGILATGSIAHKFAIGIGALDDATIMAVGSRSQVSADRFADEFDVPNRHASYDWAGSNHETFMNAAGTAVMKEIEKDQKEQTG